MRDIAHAARRMARPPETIRREAVMRVMRVI
jgi:hypothetical protein